VISAIPAAEPGSSSGAFMSPVYHSGAFVQQCFAVHPLSLALKTLNLPGRVVLACGSCKMTHQLMLRGISTRASALAQSPEEVARQEGAPTVASTLGQCGSIHPTSLKIRAMDVVQEHVGLRCAECRCLFDLDVASFETRQV
jgi:hypothetical protein